MAMQPSTLSQACTSTVVSPPLWYYPHPHPKTHTCSVRASPGSRVRASGPTGVLPCVAQQAVKASS
jgi:hypothetical protein